MNRRAAASVFTLAASFSPGAHTASYAQQTTAEPAICSLVINRHDVGDTRVLFTNSDAWVPATVLQQAGLYWTAAAERNVDNDVFILLRSMVPKVTVSFDPAEVRLTLDAPAESFGSHTIETGPRSIRPGPDNASLFLNYGATAARGARLSYAGELGARVAGALLSTTWSESATGQRVRGATTATIDDAIHLMRWEAGDSLARSTTSGQAIPIAGLTISREFGINPVFLRNTPFTVTGATAVPATAEVYVNGQLVNRASLEAGRFELRDVALPVGANNVRVLIRDDFGRVQELTSSSYRSPRVLRAGLHEFRYSVGFPRVESATRLWEYHGLVALAEHRVGLTRFLTAGATAEVSHSTAGAGADIALGSPAGELEVDYRTSHQSHDLGDAWIATYGYRKRAVSVGASWQRFSPTFVSVGSPILPIQFATAAEAFFGFTLPAGVSVTARYATGRGQRADSINRSTLSTNFSLARRTSLSVSVFQADQLSVRSWGGLAMMTVPLGGRSSASTSVNVDNAGHATTGASVQRTLPLGPGIGYRAQWRNDVDGPSEVALQLQGSSGLVDLRRVVTPAGATETMNVAGAVTLIGGGVHFSRPVDDAFALIRVGRASGVRTYVSNQYVGRTNETGEIVVPSLSSYYPNRVAINEGDLPWLSEVSEPESQVVPRFRGGSIVSFAVRETRTVTGQFALPASDGGATEERSAAEAIWPDGIERVWLDAAGQFTFRQATSGKFDVHVIHQGKTYSCALKVADAVTRKNQPQLLGVVSCSPAVTAGGGQ